MRRPNRSPSGLDLFWEDADLSDSAEHPLRRELAHRLDVLARYERLIDDAQGQGNDELLSNLTEQHGRQLHFIEQLEAALRRQDRQFAARQRTTDATDTLSLSSRAE